MFKCIFLEAYILIRMDTTNTLAVTQPTIIRAVPLEIWLLDCGGDVSLVLVGLTVGVAVGLADGVVVGAVVGVAVGFVVG